MHLFLTGEIVGTLTTDKESLVLQYQTKTIRTIITFTCDHQGQVSGVSVDRPTYRSANTDSVYCSFTGEQVRTSS